jgi:hypothetical protein
MEIRMGHLLMTVISFMVESFIYMQAVMVLNILTLMLEQIAAVIP